MTEQFRAKRLLLKSLALVVAIYIGDAAGAWMWAKPRIGTPVLDFLAGAAAGLCVANFLDRDGRARLARWWTSLPMPLGARILIAGGVLIALGHLVAQHTIYPFTNVGMFEDPIRPYQKGTRIYTPYMYTTKGPSGLRVHSIRRASTLWSGEFTIPESMYTGMVYFKYRHMKKVRETLNQYAIESGLGPMRVKNILYTFDVGGRGMKILSAQDALHFSPSPARFFDSRDYRGQSR